jgi:glycosyltransferase involved in cell wall biosynthesis
VTESIEAPQTTATGSPTSSDRRLRVVHLVPTFTGGGAERQLVYLSRALAELRVDVHIGYLRDGPNLKLLAGSGVTVHRLEAEGSHDLRLPWTIYRLLKRLDPDVVQTWLPQMDVLGGIAARLASIPWILSERSAASAYPSGWKSRARRFIGRGASAIVANSAIGLEYWRHAAGRTLRRTIRNIVPLDAIAAAEFTPSEREALTHRAAPLIVAAGRLQAEKNWGVFIDALDLALGSLRGAQAIIFGDGTFRQELERQVAGTRFADRIRLEPYTEHLWKWLKVADCYVSVSRFEGSPNVVLEALACGVPLVVSDIPAHREILPGPGAELVAPDSAQDVANALIRILGEGPVSRRGAPAFLRDWGAECIAGQYATLYRELSRRDAATISPTP